MKKKIAAATAALIASASLFGLAPSAAYAHDMQNDPGVTITKTGGIDGVYDKGIATITNYGHTTIPAGVVLVFGAKSETPIPEPHITSVLPTNYTELVVLPVSLNYLGNGVKTLKPLEPGQSFTYKWTVLHYGLWHRVTTTNSIFSLPYGYTDENLSNNSVTVGSDGHTHS